jgi:crossover junction endodeoxyribonuclease RusA
VRITVNGIPAPQGSKRHVGGGRMVESSRAVAPWREAVRAETQRVVEESRVTGIAIDLSPYAPLIVDASFYLPRPKSTPKRVDYPAKRPDLDKLVRAVLDGLQAGGAFADDGQVVDLYARKSFASEARPPGCVIEIEEA